MNFEFVFSFYLDLRQMIKEENYQKIENKLKPEVILDQDEKKKTNRSQPGRRRQHYGNCNY
jgi:hypothetical protein